MPSTDFDTLVKNKSSQDDRKEKRPAFFSRLHGIPKQISDSSQSIGVNERTLKNGLMSGVILPSQISHDRWLSVVDGIIDSLILFSILIYFSIIGFNQSVIYISIIASIYMFFHILWWECSIQWLFIETIKDYVLQTRTYYYGTLVTTFFLLSSLGIYFISENNLTPKIINLTSVIEKNIKKVIQHSEITLDKNENIFEKKNKFSNSQTDKTTNTAESSEYSKINTDINLNFLLYYYYLNTVLIILMCLLFFKFSNKFYTNKRIKNMQGVEIELKSELEQKMALLKEQV